jgi:hypothetical protein
MTACRTRRTWPYLVGAIAGCLLMALSFAGKLFFKPEQVWTPEKAQEYTRVGSDLHRLTFQSRPPARGGVSRDEHLRNLANARLEYQQTKRRWEELQNELNTAKKRGDTSLAVLRWTGAAVALLCIAGWLSKRPKGK